MSNVPKHQAIHDYVLNLIQSGQYTEGQQLPTDGQLMRQFNASRPTVSKAMLNLENENLLKRKTGAGSFVVAHHTPPANKMIGLFVPELGQTEIFEPICAEIARLCPLYHANLVWSNLSPPTSAEFHDQALRLAQKYIDEKFAGVVWVPVEHTQQMDLLNQQIAQMFHKANMPVVLIDRDIIEYPERSTFDLVGIDNVRAGFIQTSYLISLNRKRIAYFVGSYSAPTGYQRVLGYQMALAKYNCPLSDKFIVIGDLADSRTIDRILALKPEAVICSCDFSAGLLMRQLLTRGVRIPQDMGIVGLDDVRHAQLLPVTLTTLAQPCRDIGAAAIATLARRIENRELAPSEIRFHCELRVRQSCGADLAQQKWSQESAESSDGAQGG
ncbi:MAG: GntR family transcriptional regulator [Planctomycetia bacterium]|nr:GntR family transcriptional regulator [Planctomycetia bacterium]